MKEVYQNQIKSNIYFMSDLHGLVEHKYITQKSLKTILKISMIFLQLNYN